RLSIEIDDQHSPLLPPISPVEFRMTLLRSYSPANAKACGMPAMAASAIEHERARPPSLGCSLSSLGTGAMHSGAQSTQRCDDQKVPPVGVVDPFSSPLLSQVRVRRCIVNPDAFRRPKTDHCGRASMPEALCLRVRRGSTTLLAYGRYVANSLCTLAA